MSWNPFIGAAGGTDIEVINALCCPLLVCIFRQSFPSLPKSYSSLNSQCLHAEALSTSCHHGIEVLVQWLFFPLSSFPIIFLFSALQVPLQFLHVPWLCRRFLLLLGIRHHVLSAPEQDGVTPPQTLLSNRKWVQRVHICACCFALTAHSS